MSDFSIDPTKSTRGDETMDNPDFLESVAESRIHFLSMLAAKIQETNSALAHMVIGDAYSICAVEDAYRRFHDLCGISATAGLDVTCRVARTIDAILSVPFRARRGLSLSELDKLKNSLQLLQLTASNEMRSKEF